MVDELIPGVDDLDETRSVQPAPQDPRDTALVLPFPESRDPGGASSTDGQTVMQSDLERAVDQAITDPTAPEVNVAETSDVEQSSQNSNPTPNGEVRGIPTRAELVERQQLLRRGGRARIDALTRQFGDDALVLGHLLFQVPPLAIRVKKGNITYRWKPLRTKESTAIKSGNGECYIEIDLVFLGADGRRHIAELFALWKRVPFCFIENAHIRKMVIPGQQEDSMAVCLETIVADVQAGKPNAVYATLILRWFNYKPFSQNFWFRRTWEPNDPTLQTSSGSAEDENPEAPPLNASDTSIVDLSEIESGYITDHVLPPEVRLGGIAQSENPGDPRIKPTHPTVYPFNSTPFMQRVFAGGTDAPPGSYENWSDGLTMKWKTFIRTSVPSQWQYALGQQTTSAEIPVSSDTSRDRVSEEVPNAVTGDRDTIVFLGDSIMVGFLGVTGNATLPPGSGGPPWGTPTFFEFEGTTKFPAQEGFSYVAMCRGSAGTPTLRRWWNSKKTDARLKHPGEADGSRVAGVVIHTGVNDLWTGPDMGAMGSLLESIASTGAMPILLPLPPFADATHLDPVQKSHLRSLGGWNDAHYETYLAAVQQNHTTMVNLARGVTNGFFLDYHGLSGESTGAVEAQFRGNRGASLRETYMAKMPGNIYNIHWNDTGKSDMGRWIKGHLPWPQLRGETSVPPVSTEEDWTICNIEDGDTVWAYGPDPQNDRTVLRKIRMKWLDTLETYPDGFSDPSYDHLFPRGQDSFRPANESWGNLAKVHLEDLLGGVGSSVRVEWHGTGAYGRWLGEIYKGSENINLKMVSDGFGFLMDSSYAPGNSPPEQRYIDAKVAAERNTSGVYNIHAVELLPTDGDTNLSELTSDQQDMLSRSITPKAFRSAYRPNGDASETPAQCLEHVLEESAGGDPDDNL